MLGLDQAKDKKKCCDGWLWSPMAAEVETDRQPLWASSIISQLPARTNNSAFKSVRTEPRCLYAKCIISPQSQSRVPSLGGGSLLQSKYCYVFLVLFSTTAVAAITMLLLYVHTTCGNSTSAEKKTERD